MRRVTFLPEPDFCFALSVNHSLWDLNDVTLAYGDGYCDAVKTTKIVSSIDFYISKQRERFTRFRFLGIYDIVSTDLRLFLSLFMDRVHFWKGVWNQTPYYCHFKSLTISMFFLARSEIVRRGLGQSRAAANKSLVLFPGGRFSSDWIHGNIIFSLRWLHNIII